MTCIKQTCWRTSLFSSNCVEDTSGKWRSQSKEPTYPPAPEAEEPNVSEHLATRPCHGSGWYWPRYTSEQGIQIILPRKAALEGWERHRALRWPGGLTLIQWGWDDSVTRGSAAMRQVKGIPELRSVHFSILCLTPPHSTSSGSEEGVLLLSGCTNSSYGPFLRVSFIKWKVRITVSPSKTCWRIT